VRPRDHGEVRGSVLHRLALLVEEAVLVLPVEDVDRELVATVREGEELAPVLDVDDAVAEPVARDPLARTDEECTTLRS
jgi:hypothetical protein